jgi:succinate-semialdehyde dehydrogenase/glutarate-semialdehyde dehydrogenase
MAYTSTNPYTNEVLAHFPDATDSEIDQVLDVAHGAFLGWRETPIAERCAILSRASELMTARRRELAETSTLEIGRILPESLYEVDLTASILDYYAHNAERILQPERLSSVAGNATVVYQPTGIIYAIEPFNGPFYQAIRPAAPQLALGNVVIVKQASILPQSAQALEELLHEAGVPAGVFTNVYATHAQSERIIADDRVRGVTLTGSEAAGMVIAAQAGTALKKSVLELGGSDAMLVLEDADLDLAVTCAVSARMAQGGQICVASKRIIVAESRYEEFLGAYQSALAGLRGGDPLHESTTLGPLSSQGAADLVKSQIRLAVEHGANAIEVGETVPSRGAFVQPTILLDVTADNPVFRQEIFGPVPMVFRAENEGTAIALANDTPFGLAGSVYSRDAAHAADVAKRIDTGMVWINSPAGTVADLPFGGVKRSGYGYELGEAGIKEFANRKLIVTTTPTS